MTGRPVPKRVPVAQPSPFLNMEQIAAALAQISDLHKKVVDLCAGLEEKYKNFDAIKAGPPGNPGLPGVGINHDAVVADVLKQMRQPADGKSPGIEALAGALLPLVIKQINSKLPELKGAPGAPGVGVDAETVVNAFFASLKSGKRKLTVAHIDGLDGKIAEVRNAAAMGNEIYGKNTWKRGGGDTVKAGTGVTIVENVDGQKVINATGAGGFSIITVNGTIDDSNTAFTAASEPKLLNISGAFYQKTGGAYTWTYVAGNITLNVAVGAGGSIFGI